MLPRAGRIGCLGGERGPGKGISMRPIGALLLAALGVSAAAAPASATPTPFSGTLSITFSLPFTTGGPYVPLPAVTVTASGVADVTRSGGSITSFSLAGGTFATAITVPVTDPASPISQEVVNLANGSASLGTIPGGDINNDFITNLTGTGSGTMALQGVAKLGFFAGPLANLSVPFTAGGVNGVGLGGNVVIAFSGIPGGGNLTVRGAPWTTGTASIGTAAATGFVAGNTIQLVTPAYISTAIGSVGAIPMLAVLTLSFVPEPGTLLLLASGVGGLALLGRRAARGRGPTGGIASGA